ncbi:MAG: outer membrane protein transport protein [Verrucomicrobia subdivision 3 bacterium]|nr:outer membrane protein transport protein [Verrucomicrobiota bacterium]MCC6821340.1 outer membrane protein transport protein [Limisphaerales bacterium]
MKRSPKFTLAGVALAGVATLTSTAHAGGIALYEIATPDVGLASAGYAARADDASTLFKNPAGMSRLADAQFQGGLQALYGSVSFTSGANTSPGLGTDDGGNAIGWLPGASLFVVVPLGEKWRVGLGTLSYFGLAADYNDNWVGRYYVQKSTLAGVTLMPSVSYQATDWLSVGVGLNAMYGLLDTELAVNNLGPADGQMTLKDKTWGLGANVGVLIQASEQTRFGITYLSAVKLDFSDTPSFTGLGPVLGAILANPAELNLGMNVPQSVMVSGYHKLNEQWALMADVGWQDWSEFGYVQAGVEAGGTTTVNLQYQDTFHGALGAQYQASEKWRFSGGVAFDSSAVTSENRTVTLPMGQAWRFGLGAQYQLSHAVNIGAAYTFMWAGNMAVDQGADLTLRGRVAGSYEDAWFSFANLNLTWKF